MASFIDLDSIFRDREVWPNPADYTLSESQVDTWYKEARSVRAYPQNPNIQPLEFATTLNITYLTIPYTEELASIPRVYIDIHSREYKDIHLISAINGKQPDAKFICSFDKIQFDNNFVPTWIHYKCDMEQTMRFRRGDPITFKVMTRNGNVLPNGDTLVPDVADPNKQILCTLAVTPYIRDGDYDNHLVETHV